MTNHTNMSINQISEILLKNIEERIALIIAKEKHFYLIPLFKDREHLIITLS